MRANFTNSEHTIIRLEHDNGEIVFLPADETNKFYRRLLENKVEIEPYTEPEIPVENKREQEYDKCGCTIEAITVALWESIIEDRPEAAAELQKKREEVKAMYPK
jgi:hypothetical protein